jgi:hypothetical protein
MNISLNPSYLCNLRCEFCYLGDKLGDPKKIPLDVLDDRLKEVKSHSEIEHIDLYGGEVLILPDEYLKGMMDVIRQHYTGKINLITNLTKVKRWFIDRDDIDISVSFDFECRSGYQTTLNNLMTLTKPVAVLMLASPKLMSLNVEEMLAVLNNIPALESVEIKPYSSNFYNQLPAKFSDYEEFVKKFIRASDDGRLKPFLSNIKYIEEVLSDARNAYSDNHIYITPSGRFGVLEFNDRDEEFFLELDTFSQYLKWSEEEKVKVKSNPFCSTCKWQGKCLTEHYRKVTDTTYSCNGFKNLLDWYENAGT